MIRAALRALAGALAPRPAAPVAQSPEAIAVRLISDIVPPISVAVFHGTPLAEIRRQVIAMYRPIWERDHGWSVAIAAEKLLNELGPIVFLSVDEARRAGLLVR